ncbi:hypothetical protein ABW19_dt0208680 [Dactylella cylindrospora]|nr:hypothetical protein ABW19_dt0208680 [Dactylella cylindrospora]
MPSQTTMTSPIPTVALISGGKDSFFSLLHSNANGFRVIALANLHPPLPPPSPDPQTTSDDLNSFMYQTVGHNVLPHYSTILGIPLYRAAITGSSINQELSYHPSAEDPRDEIEDLYELLKKVKEAHPEIGAVSSGAILSSYQRTRVESVCQRLGLISVAWLWQRKQEMVLSEMGEVGLDARIIKVASLGLDEGWLGRNVADYKTRMALERVKKRWGGNVAGEGGEFETLVMGCRGWEKRVEVRKSQTVDEGGSVAWTRFLETDVVNVEDPMKASSPPKPPILDVEFQQVLQKVKASKDTSQNTGPWGAATFLGRFSTGIQPSPRNIYISNLSSTSKDLEAQINDIFTELEAILQKNSSTGRQITSTLLLLRSMSDFQFINKPYSVYFSAFPNPPSRVCVSIGEAMPDGIDILLSAMVDRPAENDTRKALHVQSRSYWAPANVGPYSQGIAVEGVVAIAGMIGLVPETMSAWTDEGVNGETLLALQSMVRVGRGMNIHGKKGWLGGVGFVTDESFVDGMKLAWREWFQISQRDEESASDDESSEDSPGTEQLNYFERSDLDITSPLSSSKRSWTPPQLLIVQVAQLPIQSNVEFACVGIDSAFLTSKGTTEEAENVDDYDAADSIWQPVTDSFSSPNGMVASYTVEFGYHSFIWGAISGDIGDVIIEISKLRKAGFIPVSLTVYLSSRIWQSLDNLSEGLKIHGFEGVGFVPVSGVWWSGDNGSEKDLGFAARLRKVGPADLG